MNNAVLRIITASAIAVIFLITFFYFPPRIFSLILGAILAIIVTTEWKHIFSISSILFWVTLPIYPILPFILLILLNESPMYRILIVYLFVIVFTFDSTSYICGKLCGKNKIIPLISPGKTWEGAIGGYLFTTIVFMLIAFNQKLNVSIQAIFLLMGITCGLAFAGDVFESYLKRSANIKDSGNLLPGHGGFLDRFDAIIMVSYFLFIFKNSLLQLLTN